MSEAAGRPVRRHGEFDLAGRLVHPELNRITHDGRVIQVEPKAMQVLLLLCERPGEVVQKRQLIEGAWPGVFVTEDVLVRAVGELRKAFGDDSENPRVIETVRTRGYRLVAPVVHDAVPGPPQRETRQRERSPRLTRWAAVALAAAAVVAGVVVVLGSRSTTRPEPRFAPLTSLVGNEHDPALSPDGTRVAFGWDRGDDGPTDLYVKAVDADPPLALTRDRAGDRAAVWSADGSRLAFLRTSAGDCEIRVVSALGGPSQRLAPCLNPHHPRFAWSPDGRRIAGNHGTRPWSGGIGVQDLASGAIVDRTAPAPGRFDDAPVFSPDGTTLAFLRSYSDSVGDLWVAGSDAGDPQALTSDNADIMGIAWIERGHALAIGSNRAGMYSLWRVPVDGGPLSLLAGGGRKLKHPSASRDGGAVAYEAWNYDMNLWRLPLGAPGSGEAVAAASDEWTFEPQYSPDGSRLAFVSTRSGSYELWVCDRDGASPERLTSFGGPYVGLPRWSPDGRRVLFYSRGAGAARAWTVDADGGGAHEVETGPGEAMAPSFSADGRSIYFAARLGGVWQVMVQPAGGGAARPVTSDGGYVAIESPVGRWLYYSRIDRAGLWRRPASGGAAEQVVEGLQPEDGANWAVTASHVYWVERSPGDAPPVVVRRPLGGGPMERMAGLPRLGWAGIAVSPDGREVAYSRVEHHESNLAELILEPAREGSDRER